MDDYQTQALDFLAKTGTRFEIVYQYTGAFFESEKDFRDVYKFTLTNAKGSYSSTFGDSMHNTKRREAGKNRSVSAYDILVCLEKYVTDTFDGWCADYGYNDKPLSEYPEVMKVYQSCVEQYRGLSRIFSDAEMELLREII